MELTENRLDILVMKKAGFSREYAKEAIKKGNVSVNGKVMTKSGSKVGVQADIEINIDAMKYVGRGGYKLEYAIEHFNIQLSNLICGDIGASTGGFTDCMLQYGAKRIYAIDVGTNQLAEKLKLKEEVISMEGVNIKEVYELPEKLDFVAVDVSFISITKIIENVIKLLKEKGCAVCLIKPQFEAGKESLNKKGVVKDQKYVKMAVKNIKEYFKCLNLQILDIIESPIKGKEGNSEFLFLIKK